MYSANESRLTIIHLESNLSDQSKFLIITHGSLKKDVKQYGVLLTDL